MAHLVLDHDGPGMHVGTVEHVAAQLLDVPGSDGNLKIISLLVTGVTGSQSGGAGRSLASFAAYNIYIFFAYYYYYIVPKE